MVLMAADEDEQYTLEQAEEDIAVLRGQVDALNEFFAITGSANEASIVTITDSTTGDSNPAVIIIMSGSGDNSLGFQVSGDTFTRLRIDSNGMLRWGSGAAGQDCRLYRSSAGVLGVDTLLANVSGAVETWHSLGTLAGYSVSAGRYRLTNDNHVELDIQITAGGANNATVTFANALPVAYRPTADRHLPLAKASTIAAGDTIPRVFVQQSTGSVQVVQNASNSVTLGMNARLPLD